MLTRKRFLKSIVVWIKGYLIQYECAFICTLLQLVVFILHIIRILFSASLCHLFDWILFIKKKLQRWRFQLPLLFTTFIRHGCTQLMLLRFFHALLCYFKSVTCYLNFECYNMVKKILIIITFIKWLNYRMLILTK